MVTCVIGAQYGSEGKGAVVASLAPKYGVHVRVGGPNAGHTLWHEGREWKMRGVPCGWVNPDSMLIIGAGAVIDQELLRSEVQELEAAGYEISTRLYVDRAAVRVTGYSRMSEGGVYGWMHQAIGSTGEGVGIARMERIARGCSPYDEMNTAHFVEGTGPWTVADTVPMLADQLALGVSTLLEGTQGCGLSLIHGKWPYVTSHDTGAAQLLADAGVGPRWCDQVYLVARTFPIRVAGNSGPLVAETTWEALGQRPETTTVTGKIRRVGYWDRALFARAVELNSPTGIVLTFADYLHSEAAGVREYTDLPGSVKEWVQLLEEEHGVPVVGVGTGPDSICWRELVRYQG